MGVGEMVSPWKEVESSQEHPDHPPAGSWKAGRTPTTCTPAYRVIWPLGREGAGTQPASEIAPSLVLTSESSDGEVGGGGAEYSPSPKSKILVPTCH